jgi:BirA family biotin operon repressor/biotin-[acetyl-CoA-carboxylase] ligase
MSVLLRDWPRLLPLAAAVAVAEAAGDAAAIKWPNDVQLHGRKVAGILVEGRPQEGWMVLGIGVNVAIRPEDLPPELRETAATLGREPAEVETVLGQVLTELEAWLTAAPGDVLAAFRARDALAGHRIAWAAGSGVADGVDNQGRLRVQTGAGLTALDAGEVHLRPS